MEQHIEKLTAHLLKKNPALSKGRARTWVELLWSDFEATSAKAGYAFRGADYTANLVKQLIESYGDKLHEFAGKNPKYAHLLDNSDE
ncbi:YfhJ family protein [Metasolibacillus sp. FSL H7-0170]|uniref:YfhJ family protein n=1 Tax=Metasolibacillus TaxID=2703677 RepID=UPI000D35448B|nr:YfhJ family protein [Metasolibacillus fluoroglycofenilyticus]